MSEKELEARKMAEQIKKLPPQAQERIGYIIQGAALTAANHEAQRDAEPQDERDGAALPATPQADPVLQPGA